MLLFALGTIKILILIFYFFVALSIVLFSWLYYSRTIRASNEIGLQAPKYISLLVRISIIIATITAVLITIFLLTNLY